MPTPHDIGSDEATGRPHSRTTSRTARALARRIDRVVDRRADAYIAFLTGLLRFETISGGRSTDARRRFRLAIERCFRFLEYEAERLDLDFRTYDDLAAVAVMPSHPPDAAGSLAVATHLDVVPPGEPWRFPPFGGTVAEGAVWGRGAQDDKGPAAMAFSALDVLRALEWQPRRRIKLLMGTREETTTWPDVDRLEAEDEIADQTIVPDGAFPVINAEKGRITLAWTGSWPPPHGPAPGRPAFVQITGGKRSNMVPEEARLVLEAATGELEAVERHCARVAADFARAVPAAQLEWIRRGTSSDRVQLEVLFRGRTAHGAYPQEGRNAILDALAYLDALGDFGALTAFARDLHRRCSVLDGSAFGVDRHHEYCGDSTVNLGLIELGPSHGGAKIDVRFPFGATVTEVAARFREVAQRDTGATPGLHVDAGLEGRAQEPLFVSPQDHPEFIGTLQEAYQTVTGRDPLLRSIPGTTYAKAFPLAVAFGPLDESAGETELAHQVDEHVTVARHLENIRIYALALVLLTQASGNRQP